MPAKKKTAEKTEETVKTADGYTASDLAEELEITPAELRIHLRNTGAEKPGTRWVWPKKTDPGLSEVRKLVKERIKELASKPKADKPEKEAKPAKKLKKKTA